MPNQSSSPIPNLEDGEFDPKGELSVITVRTIKPQSGARRWPSTATPGKPAKPKKPVFLAEAPKNYSLHVRRHILSYRHPWVLDKSGRGILVNKGIKLHTPHDRDNIKTELKRLLEAAPRLRTQLTGAKIREELLQVYFDWLEEATPPPINLTEDGGKMATENEATGETEDFDAAARDWVDEEELEALRRAERAVGLELTDEEAAELFPFKLTLNEAKMESLLRFIKSLKDKISGLGIEKAQLMATNNRLVAQLESKENQIAQLAKDAGARREHELTITLGQCLDHFRERWNPPGEHTSGGQKIDMVRRAERVVEALGPEMPYSKVTRELIRSTINGLKRKRGKGVIADNTKINLRQGMKAFCNFLTWTSENDGLGLSLNPTQGLSVGSKQAIQQRKQKRGEIEILDPRLLVKQPDISLYFRTLVGVLGFAGLRLSEAAALRWSDIDFEQKIIRVLGWEIYPDRKTVESERVVRPFANVWPLLEEFRKVRLDEKILFPRIYLRTPKANRDGTPWTPEWTWMAMVRGRLRARDLSSALKAECRRARKALLKRQPELENDKDFMELRRLVRNEPALRLRRFWSHTMDEKGMADLEVMMGGHSGATSNAYYKRQMDKILNANVPEI